MSYHIDYSDSDTDSSNSDDCNEELLNIKERPLTPSLLKTHEKKFENGLYMDDCNDVNITENREIHDYCRSDVLDTYFVYLRSRVVAGAISLADEQSLIEAAHIWIQSKAAGSRGLARYLEAWGDWQSPWG